MEAKTKAEAENSQNTPNPGGDATSAALRTDDNSSMLNHLVLLGAVAMLGYLAHTVIKSTQDFTGQ